MCINGYYKVSPTTNIEMIYCKLFEDKENDLEQLCCNQRFCKDLDKYIEHEKINCKLYKN